MKDYVTLDAQEGVAKGDILAISAEAKRDKASGNKVIDASIGAFLDDDKTLAGVRLIKESLQDNVPTHLAYPPIWGYEDYNKGVFSWVFKDHKAEVEKLYVPFTGATLGGTGAAFIAFSIFVAKASYVLLPSIMWNNYKQIARQAGVGHKTYELFNAENGFNIASLKEQIEDSLSLNKEAFVVINDPCQNPTGYSLTSQEYDELFEMLNKEGSKGKLTVLFDIAYIDYYDSQDEPECPLIPHLVSSKAQFLPLLGFSCSKTFGLYGLRSGALIALAPDEKNATSIKAAFGAKARGIYSCPVGASLYSVSQVLSNEKMYSELEKEIKDNCKELADRSQYYLSLLDKYGLTHLPYHSGFFITVNVNDAFMAAKVLKEHHMYVIPLDASHIRLAISGLGKDEGEELISLLAEEGKK